MKKKTFEMLSRVPIVGTIAKLVLVDPSVFCSPARDEGLISAVNEYAKAHPDELITKKVYERILKTGK